MPDEKLAVQVSYSIRDESTYNREVPSLVKYAKTHEDWKCLLINPVHRFSRVIILKEWAYL